MDLFITLIGVLIAQYLAMALRMSLYRLAWNRSSKKNRVWPAEADHFGEFQLLIAEWCPVGCALLLALQLKVSSPATFPSAVINTDKSMRTIAEWLSIAFVASRIVFGLRAPMMGALIPGIVGILSMTICYVTSFALLGFIFF